MKITFLVQDRTIVCEAQVGARLLDVAHAAGVPLEGSCDGALACATCHVVIAAEWFDRLEPARFDEEDMLDFAPHVTRRSRLACQIHLRAEQDGLVVHLPQR